MTARQGYRVRLSHFSCHCRRRRVEPLMYRSWFFAAAAMVALFDGRGGGRGAASPGFSSPGKPARRCNRSAMPGEVETAPGKSYPMIAKNKPNASHYFIEVEGANPTRRWVVDCGEHVVSADGSSQPQEPGSGEDGDADTQRAGYVLSVSWQPAFCETKRDKAECAT
jgi:hypothetical protein